MAPDKQEYHILVIEDNPGDFALVEDFLFEQIVAPQITNATTCQGAIEALAAAEFDIILLDLSLPDKTGEPLIKAILDKAVNCPVIVLTGYADISFGLKSLSLGVSDYILKDDLTSMSLYKSVIYSIERKRNNIKLEQSEKNYSDLFHLSPLPMWVVDLNTLKFLDINKSTIDHYGFTREEFLSMTLKDIRPVEEWPNLEIGVAKGKLEPRAIQRRMAIHKKKNGDLINVEIQISPIQYHGKSANVVVAADVTERIRYTKAMEAQNERLKEIAWIQSHIVRAPLSRIMGLIPLLENQCDNEKEMKQMLGYLLTSANELDEIITRITDKSKIEDFRGLKADVKRA
jgi:PAS domain S-box-containing protein